jgi:hypothetical protein
MIKIDTKIKRDKHLRIDGVLYLHRKIYAFLATNLSKCLSRFIAENNCISFGFCSPLFF